MTRQLMGVSQISWTAELEQKMFEWKSEIIDVVDGLVKKIRDGREFRKISGHQTADNTRRIEKLERKVFGVAEV